MDIHNCHGSPENISAGDGTRTHTGCVNQADFKSENGSCQQLTGAPSADICCGPKSALRPGKTADGYKNGDSPRRPKKAAHRAHWEEVIAPELNAKIERERRFAAATRGAMRIPWERIQTKRATFSDSSVEDLLDVFKSSAPERIADQSKCRRIIRRTKDGQMIIRRALVPFRPMPVKHTREWFQWVQMVTTRGNESNEHVELKHAAYCWLRSLGSEAVGFEKRYSRGRADVVSADFDVIVECGNTDPVRAECVLKEHRLFVALPFGPYGDGYAEAYLFSGTNSGREIAIKEERAALDLERANLSLLQEAWSAFAKSGNDCVKTQV
jgi:hypothetical protein